MAALPRDSSTGMSMSIGTSRWRFASYGTTRHRLGHERESASCAMRLLRKPPSTVPPSYSWVRLKYPGAYELATLRA